MTHETAVLVSQMVALALFGSMFAAVIAYVLWPGNRDGFEQAARLPITADDNETGTGLHHGE